MYLSRNQRLELGRLLTCLVEERQELELREQIGRHLVRLTRSEYFASFVWSEANQQFSSGIQIGMSERNIDAYARYFQFRDPITFQLKRRAVPTLVSEIMPHDDLRKTEFFNDFLQRDGLCYGVNMYCLDERQQHVGDFRLWRPKSLGDFDSDARDLLNLTRPMITVALARARCDTAVDVPACGPQLSSRERQIAERVALGETDKEIARSLGISATTVRTHVNHIYEKLEVTRRAAVGAALNRRRPC